MTLRADETSTRPAGGWRPSRRTVAEALLAMVAGAWALGFIVMKLAVTDHPVWMVLWLRFALATFLLAPFCADRRRWRLDTVAAGCGLGVLLFASFSCLISGLQQTTATHTGLLTGLCVVWVPIFGWLIAGVPVRVGTWLGITLCMGGVAVMAGDGSAPLGTGDLLVAAGSVLTALHLMGLDRFAPAHDASALSLVQLGTVALLSLVVASATGVVWPATFDAALATALVVSAGVSTTAAFWIQTRFQRETTPTRAAMIFNLEPVFAALLAAAFLAEPMGAHVALACALIVAGMCATEWRPRR